MGQDFKNIQLVTNLNLNKKTTIRVVITLLSSFYLYSSLIHASANAVKLDTSLSMGNPEAA